MKRSVFPFLLIVVIVSIVLAGMLQFGMFSLWQHRFSDTLYGGIQPLNNIVIVAIDDKSLQEIGRWPWKRNVYVDFLDKIKQSRLVGFDVSFFEPSTPEDDEALGKAIQKAGNVIIPTEIVQFEKQNGVLAGKEWLLPIKELENANTGIVNIFTDADGVSRSVPVHVDGISSLSFMIAEKFIGKKPAFDEPRMLVNFVGRPQSYKTYSFSDVLHDSISADEFKDKIVLIGATASDLHDDYLVPTSWGKRMSGVEIHAHALQTILSRRFLHEQSFFSIAIVMLALSLITALLFWLFGLRALWSFPVFVAGIIAAALILYNRGIIVNLIHQPLAFVLTNIVCVAYIARTEAAYKKYILSVFGRYVSKEVVKHLLEHKEALKLGGQEREISVLFVDIRGFTAISEKLSPQQVITFLNHYFGEMTDAVFKNNGTLDKFIGDSIMAVFNSPHDDPEHALNAVKTALEMQAACKRLQKKGLPKIRIGIGVNTGPAVIGNMGSSQRQEFTALGDTVNTSSRLCGVAEGGQIIIAESTHHLVQDHIIAKKLTPIKVKGKEKPLVVYEVLRLKK